MRQRPFDSVPPKQRKSLCVLPIPCGGGATAQARQTGGARVVVRAPRCASRVNRRVRVYVSACACVCACLRVRACVFGWTELLCCALPVRKVSTYAYSGQQRSEDGSRLGGATGFCIEFKHLNDVFFFFFLAGKRQPGGLGGPSWAQGGKGKKKRRPPRS